MDEGQLFMCLIPLSTFNNQRPEGISIPFHPLFLYPLLGSGTIGSLAIFSTIMLWKPNSSSIFPKRR